VRGETERDELLKEKREKDGERERKKVELKKDI